jgi:hypothetical protein
MAARIKSPFWRQKILNADKIRRISAKTTICRYFMQPEKRRLD